MPVSWPEIVKRYGARRARFGVAPSDSAGERRAAGFGTAAGVGVAVAVAAGIAVGDGAGVAITTVASGVVLPPSAFCATTR